MIFWKVWSIRVVRPQIAYLTHISILLFIMAKVWFTLCYRSCFHAILKASNISCFFLHNCPTVLDTMGYPRYERETVLKKIPFWFWKVYSCLHVRSNWKTGSGCVFGKYFDVAHTRVAILDQFNSNASGWFDPFSLFLCWTWVDISNLMNKRVEFQTLK